MFVVQRSPLLGELVARVLGDFRLDRAEVALPDDDQPTEASSGLEFCIRLVDGTVLKTFEDAPPLSPTDPPCGAECKNDRAVDRVGFCHSACKFASRLTAEHFCDDEGCQASVERSAATQLANDFAYVDRQLLNRPGLAGDHLTAADFHLFVFGRLGLRLAPSTREFPNFHRHTLAIASLEATRNAMAEQGIALEGLASGPG